MADAPRKHLLPQDINPCLHCGACCAYFRVSFYWQEAGEEPAGAAAAATSTKVPFELTKDVDQFYRCMKGTDQRQQAVRCEALQGAVGSQVNCAIYSRRPSPCREFAASYSDGHHNERCDRVRAAHGLRALTPEDWRRDESMSPVAEWDKARQPAQHLGLGVSADHPQQILQDEHPR